MLLGLIIIYKKKRFAFSNRELLDLAKAELNKKFNTNGTRTLNLPGTGDKETPYVINTINDWIKAVRILEEAQAAQRYIFFNIRDRLIRVSVEDKYVADFGPIVLTDPRVMLMRKTLADSNDRPRNADMNSMRIIVAMYAAIQFLNEGPVLTKEMMALFLLSFYGFLIASLFFPQNYVTSRWEEIVTEIRGEIDAIEGLRPSYRDMQSYFKDLEDDENPAEFIREIIRQPYPNAGAILEIFPLICATLILGEGSRNRMSVVVTLMLLDFIQNQICYGNDNKKIITLYKALSSHHVGNRSHVDGYGKIVNEDIDANGDGERRWGGKLPMANDGSFLETRNERGAFANPLNKVRQKEGSTLIRWLGLRTKSNLEALGGCVAKDGIHVVKATPQNQGDLNRACKKLKLAHPDDPDRELIKNYFGKQIQLRLETPEVFGMKSKTLAFFPS
jgi:hypothetical protein